MMRETENVRQIKGESLRRWFWSDYFDLIVWLGPEDEITGFQLCYDKKRKQRVLTWKEGSGFSHDRIDDGESFPDKYKATPILTADGIFEKENIAVRFSEESKKIEKRIADFVYTKITEYRVK